MKSEDPAWAEQLYDFLANDEEARVCKAISDDACRVVPGNFLRIFVANTLTKIGDRLASAKTTLPWVLQALGAPGFFTGLLVPLRESGSLLPQLLIASFVRKQPVRKWLWVGGSVLQAVCVLGMAATALTLQGAAAGWALLALLGVFSLARGFCSIASKDVLGKTIPKSRRGRLKGLMSSASGLIAITAGGGLMFSMIAEEGELGLYAAFLTIAGLLWLLAAGAFATVREFAGETDGGGDALKQAASRLKILKEEPHFTRFVIVRALAIGSGMSAPFIIALAHGELGGAAFWLGIFIIADGLAAMISGPILGKLADRSSRNLLTGAMLVTTLIGAAAILWSLASPPDMAQRLFYPLLFFTLGLAHNATRLGRKTYLVDMAEGNRRTDYVALSNTLIGVALLLAGVISALAALVAPQAAIALFSAAALTGAILGRKLPGVSARDS